MTLILAYAERNCTRDLGILNVAGELITALPTDEIRAIVCRLDEPPVLVVTSSAPTANGSTFTKNHPTLGMNRLRLDAQDLTFGCGTYTLVIEYWDFHDAGELKNVDRQTFQLEPSPPD